MSGQGNPQVRTEIATFCEEINNYFLSFLFPCESSESSSGRSTNLFLCVRRAQFNGKTLYFGEDFWISFQIKCTGTLFRKIFVRIPYCTYPVRYLMKIGSTTGTKKAKHDDAWCVLTHSLTHSFFINFLAHAYIDIYSYLLAYKNVVFRLVLIHISRHFYQMWRLNQVKMVFLDIYCNCWIARKGTSSILVHMMVRPY